MSGVVVQINNTFLCSMQVTRISFQPDNTGFYFEAYKGGLIMHSQTSTTVSVSVGVT